MNFKKSLLTIGVSLLGFCAAHSSTLAHNPGKVRAINVTRDYVSIVVYQTPDLTLRKRAILVAKRKQVRTIRRLVRASLRH